MKSKIFIFTTFILVVFLFVITSCDNFLNAKNKTTININLDLSKILKTSRNETTTSITDYILKVFAYNAATYKPEAEIQNLPLLTQTENKVDINGNVKASLDVEIGLNVIFVAKLYQGKSEKPLYAGKSEVIKIKATNNKVHLVLTREKTDLEIDVGVEEHEHTFATDWTKDETHHWYAATCEHTTEVSEKAAHTFGNWTTTKEATEETEGSRERSCTVCEYTATEVIAKLEHKHTYSEDWSKDETYHWYAATCEHTTEVSEKAEHSYTDGMCECGMREMVLIPAGTFQMGSNDSISTAKPVQDVTITKSFYMGKFEVTQAEYEKYCSYTGSGSPSSRGDGDNYPAYWVNWYDALVYCNKRSITEGLTPCYSISGNTDPSTWGNVPSFNDTNWIIVVCDWEANGYRLPTEAEWEYAARAGDNISSYAWSGTSNRDELVDYAWFIDNSNDKIHEVGTKKANSFGLYDMSGNVEEWCWNWYTSSYSAGTEGGSDPTGASSGTDRVTRGGCWRSYAGNIYVNFRNYNAALNHVETCGFRVVRLAE